MALIGVAIALGGVFALTGAVCNWNWFFESRKTKPLVKLMGRTGTRVRHTTPSGVGLTAQSN